MTDLSPNSLNANLKIVKTEIKPSGEAIQVVRPLVPSAKTTDQIVGELVNRFDYRSGEVKASENELNTVQQAFGSNLANELIKTYEGSNLVSDSQQDLVGDKYLAEQIRMIQEQQKTTSILDKWGHLLYEGERDYKSAVSTGSKTSLTGGQSIGNGTSNCNSGSGGYATTYSNGSIAHYNQLIEEHNKKLQQQQQQEEQEQQQQQPDMIQQYQEQLQQEQQDLQEQQEAAIQQAVAAVQQQEAAAAAAAVQSALRSSQSGNLAASNSNHRLLAAVNSQNAMASYAQSQSGLQSRTLSEVRLQAQLRAQLEAQAQARAQAQLQAQLQAQAQAQAQALAHARAVEQVRQQQQQQQQTCAQQLNRSMSGIGASSEVRSAIGVSAAPVQSHSQHSLHQQQQQLQHQQSHQSLSAQQQNQQQQAQPFLPQLSSNNLKSVTLEAYNSPQFKAMLEQLSKPISVPPEQINYPPEWPSQDKINLLAEPIYIPAPQPIVIPAPNIITIESQPLDAPTFSRHDLPDAAVKPTVTYYPSISTDQAHMKNFGIRQLNLDTNLNRTASVINQAQQQQQHQY